MFWRITCVLFALLATFQCISALKCYKCHSSLDSNCGKTFGYDKDSEDAKAIIVDCGGNFTACRKVVHSDTHKAVEFVERGCWTYNNNGTVSSDFYDCKNYNYGDVCYCTDKDNAKYPCNDQTRVRPTLAVFLLGLLPLGLFL